MKTENHSTSLKNKLLIATSKLQDPFFADSVMYVCDHSEDGAMGILINRPTELTLVQIFDQLHIKAPHSHFAKLPILAGGPIHPEKGFVLHPNDHIEWQTTLHLDKDINLTTSRDIISAFAEDHGPKEALIALGFSGWAKGQLEQEIIESHWIVVPATPKILFETPFAERREAAAALLGIDIHLLSPVTGHA